MPCTEKQLVETIGSECRELAIVAKEANKLLGNVSTLQITDLIMQGLYAFRNILVQLNESDRSARDNAKIIAIHLFDKHLAGGQIDWPGPNRIVERQVRRFVPEIVDRVFDSIQNLADDEIKKPGGNP